MIKDLLKFILEMIWYTILFSVRLIATLWVLFVGSMSFFGLAKFFKFDLSELDVMMETGKSNPDVWFMVVIALTLFSMGYALIDIIWGDDR